MIIKPDEPNNIYFNKEETTHLEALKSFLTYTDNAVQYAIQQHKHASWFLNKYGEEKYIERLNELKSQTKKCLLLQNENDEYYTYAGLRYDLEKRFNFKTDNNINYPSSKNIPWSKTPSALRPYQQSIVNSLLKARHGAVSVGTGLGKSLCALYICKALALKTIIMVPSINIGQQIYNLFLTHFGRKYVGMYGGGKKKEYNKLFTVGIAASLTKIDTLHEAYPELSQAQVFIADESHQTPASTFEKVCSTVAAKATYRFFFSGTQTRIDGSELLLKGIIGPIVYSMSVFDGVANGYLAKPIFKVLEVKSKDSYHNTKNALKMTQKHLYYNPDVNALAGNLANKAVKILNHPVLILIDEIEQFTCLLPHLQYPVGFAHADITPANKKKIPKEYHDSDPGQLVEDFNNLKFPILIGTSCISTGTDIKAVKTMIYLMGGKSVIQVSQSVGRTTRLVTGKDSCIIFDFDVSNADTTHRHALERIKIYNSIYPGLDYIKYG